MTKTEIFAEILSDVCSETEVSPELLLSGNRNEETVDARSLLIHFLSVNGFYVSEISRLVNICKRGVRHSRTNFYDRLQMSPMMRIISEKLNRKWASGGVKIRQ